MLHKQHAQLQLERGREKCATVVIDFLKCCKLKECVPKSQEEFCREDFCQEDFCQEDFCREDFFPEDFCHEDLGWEDFCQEDFFPEDFCHEDFFSFEKVSFEKVSFDKVSFQKISFEKNLFQEDFDIFWEDFDLFREDLLWSYVRIIIHQAIMVDMYGKLASFTAHTFFSPHFKMKTRQNVTSFQYHVLYCTALNGFLS